MTAEALLLGAVASRDQGRSADAHALAAEALRASAGEDSRAVEALLLLGRTSIDLCAYDEAAAALEQAVARAERLDGEAAATLSILALSGHAALARTLGRYEEAEEQYRHALSQAEPDSLDEATVANDLAVTLKFVGKLDEAEQLARRSVELRRRALGDDNPDVAADAAALAAVLDALGRDEEAETLLREAIAVFERAFGPTHYEVAFNLGQLAALLFRRGMLDEAENLYRRGLALLEDLLGRDHPDLAPPLNNLAVLLADRGDRDAAAALHRRALAILERAVQPDHPTLLACRENLAALASPAGGESEEPAEAGSS